MDPRLEKSVKSLFRGLVAGDGDVYSRMASSHEGATAPYPEPLAGIVNAIKADFDRGKFSNLATRDDYAEAIVPYFESFVLLYNPDDFELKEDEAEDE
jgi:hypothetical protein